MVDHPAICVERNHVRTFDPGRKNWLVTVRNHYDTTISPSRSTPRSYKGFKKLPPSAAATKSRPDKLLLILIALAALVLRMVRPGSIGIDHFDEGIYAFAGEWPFARGGLWSIDPAVIPYGPPMTPILIGLSFILFGGPSDFAAILPGILCGTASVLLIALLTTRIFNQRAGLFSALFLATSGAAIAFSRSALTETPLMFCWLLAMIAGLRFLKKPGLVSASGLGLGVGLCQLTKYNGALTGVIVALTALTDFILVPRETRRDFKLFVRRIAFGLFAIVVAAFLYMPWFEFVERHDGYRSLMKHHSRYMGGVSTWLGHLKLQLAQSTVFQMHWPLIVILTSGMIWLLLNDNRATPKKNQSLGHMIFLTLFTLIPNLIWVAAITMTSRLLRSSDTGQKLVAVWLIFLSILTPFYHPYARLWLPTMLASFIVVGGIIEKSWAMESSHFTKSISIKSFIKSWEFAAGLLVWLAVTSFHLSVSLPDVWSGRGTTRIEIQELIPKISATSSAGKTISIYVSPAVRWQLRNTTPRGGFGPGRLVNLSDLASYKVGPLLLDTGLLSKSELETIQNRLDIEPRQTLNDTAVFKRTRGLITVLDIAPGTARGERLPSTRLLWVDDK